MVFRIVQAEFDVTLKYLSITEDWRGLTSFKPLRDGLFEIRFTSAKVQYRPAGIYGPGVRTFTILIGCKKKMKTYDPPDAFITAKHRRKLLEQGRATLRERII